MSAPDLPPLSLYVHIPWCQRKCPYCDFNSHEPRQGIPATEYVAALLNDLEQELHYAQDRELHSIFIGGGTPSLFSVQAITHLLNGIRERIALANDVEITLEANPGSAEAGKFSGFVEAGVNRISLGIQSLDDDLLLKLGRVHSRDEALSAINMLRALPLQSFNLDLMHGLPGQDLSRAREDLIEALDQQPPHLSWYQLTIEPNTAFYSHPPQLPDELILGDIQDSGETLLDSAGLHQYEVSAYARPGHACRHNLNYWEFGDYLGIGAGAHGKITLAGESAVLRTQKTRQPDDYLARTADQQGLTTRKVPESELAGEFMMNALRLHTGFSTELFSARTGLSIQSIEKQRHALISKGLLECDAGRIRATPLGRRYLDSVIAEFL